MPVFGQAISHHLAKDIPYTHASTFASRVAAVGKLPKLALRPTARGTIGFSDNDMSFLDRRERFLERRCELPEWKVPSRDKIGFLESLLPGHSNCIGAATTKCRAADRCPGVPINEGLFTTALRARSISTASVEFHLNVRVRFERIGELAATFRSVGVREPLIVRLLTAERSRLRALTD